MLWFLSAAMAGNLYVNNVLVDPRSIANVSFEKVTVRVDAQGNVWVDAPGYRIEIQNPIPVATAPVPRPGTPQPTAPGGSAVASARWWLVTEDAGTQGHVVQVFVNGALAYTFNSGQPQSIVDIHKWLVVGPNKVRIVSTSQNSTGGSFYVYVGTGSNQSGTVVLDNPMVQFGVGSGRNGPYEREYTLSVRSLTPSGVSSAPRHRGSAPKAAPTPGVDVLDPVADAPASQEPRSQQAARRTYVLDTNVLLYDPRALFVFDEHDILLPMTVIEEIDRFKRDLNETGRNARTISRILDELRARGSLRDGVQLDGGGVLRVEYQTHGPDLDITWGPESNDNRILRQVLRLRQEKKSGYLALVTRDTNMRLKCDALGVNAEDYQNAHIEVDEQYSGVTERTTTSEIVDELHNVGHVSMDVLGDHTVAGLFPQQIVILAATDAPSKTALVRVDVRRRRLRKIARHKDGVWGIFARNKEQLFALELLLDDDIHLVTLNGSAGTGKTLLAIAAGLKKVADESVYRKMLVSRPIFPLGRDIGFLPGDIGEKLNPWMKPIYDNLELLLSTRSEGPTGRGTKNPEPEYQYLLDQKIIEVEPLTYIRGRSIPKQFLIVDEAQNLTPHELKTVLTRAGEGTKIVLTGDPEQIDNPYVDAMSNGLTYTVERFKNSEIAGHVTLKKGERSPLAELAAQLL